MTLKQRIQDDMKTAMRAKDVFRLSVIRMLLSVMKQFEVDERKEATDAIISSILKKMIKQRRDSAEQFQAAQRDELATKELQEIEILQAYLPEQLSAAEIDSAIDQAISSEQAHSIKDIGKVMAVLKGSLEGRADMAAVSAKVKQRLSNIAG